VILKEENGTMVYSDGNETELQMLEIAKQYPEDLSQDYIANNSEYTVNNTFSSVRENILNWYPFKKDCTILEIGAGMGSITGLLCNKAKSVTAVEMNSLRAKVIKARYAKRKNLTVVTQNIEDFAKEKKFDYVIMIGVLEYSEVFFNVDEPFKYMLELAKDHLKENGILLCAIENRFGLKYWCGASEDHLQEPFVGINGYSKEKTPKTLSKYALSQLFDSAKLNNKRFYYVLPDYRFPRAIYTDDYLPKPQDIDNIPFTYSKGSMLHSKEQALYNEIIKNNTFDFFANSYLIEASVKKLNKNKVNFVSARGEAKKEYRCLTTIDNKNKVTKYPTYTESKKHIKNMYDNYLYLKGRGIKQIEQFYRDGKLWSVFVSYKRADIVFEEALATGDLGAIHHLIDQLKRNLTKSSDIEIEKNIFVDLGYHNKDEYNGIILKYGFIDMTFYNAFVVKNELVFFDQEWEIENVPLDFLLYYAIKIAFNRAKISHRIDLIDLLHYAGVYKYYNEFDKFESYVWSKVLYRSGDIYGKDGYCNQYSDNLTLEYKFEQLHQEIINRQGHIEQLLETERQLTGELNNKTGHIEQLLETERQLTGELKNKTSHIEQLERGLSEQTKNVEKLNIELNNILTSRSWKLASRVSSLARKILPPGSKRRLFAGRLYKFIRHPFRFFSKLTHVSEIPQYTQKINIIESDNANKIITDYEPLFFRKEMNPVVSIVIPVYNEFNYTYNCLKSIIENSGDKVNYEILIADDCSTDLTKDIMKIVSNIRVIKTSRNFGFLGNCNNTAKYAKGKYILFLNNDTQVQENWLLSLVELIEKEEAIGAVGSKLVFEDGTLQEAGGVLWNDASAWNYGRGSDPALPEFNYVKEVDYISGAALMIRKSIWEKLGGFDETFTPAYCEDTDICFSIKKLGYKVMYQPASVVVHFEGISNGTDLSEGQKQYQVINQKKFYNKWKDVLEKEHFPNGKNVFLARDRSSGKKTLLMVDHYVPHFDKDAGSRTIFQYLKLFVSLGFNVKFIGDNFYKHEPYTTILEQMGIEVLYGNYYAQNWKAWLRENGKYIDYVFLNRPHISVNYIDEIKKYTKAKVFYYGVDLHFLREYREYTLTKDIEKMRSSKKWKKLEFAIMKKMDIAYFLSTKEIALIKEIDPSINCKILPINIFQKKKLEEFDQNRKDLIFVGGFAHAPNIDAMIWFVNSVMPLVQEAIPGILLNVIGSNAPEEIKMLERNNVKILGYVDDDTLDEYYKKCRVCIAPLRYGAGVKGKVLEAMYKQIPVITTTIGAEGLPEIEECLIIEDDAELFASKLVDMYKNDNILKKLIEKSYYYIMKNFTVDTVTDVIVRDFC
jgi:GT2 family glycosyltransferase/2-polyprenyl-3-methyl-5-hydroxy-6-metoxy-1,4-benzoquinol methylase